MRSSSYVHWWIRQNSHKLNTDYKQPFRNLFIVKQFFPFSTRRNVGRIGSISAISLVRSLNFLDKRTPLEAGWGGRWVRAPAFSWTAAESSLEGEQYGQWITSPPCSVLRALSHLSSPTRDEALRMFAWEATVWRNCVPICGLKVLLDLSLGYCSLWLSLSSSGWLQMTFVQPVFMTYFTLRPY